jgi:hypothetical protein
MLSVFCCLINACVVMGVFFLLSGCKKEKSCGNYRIENYGYMVTTGDEFNICAGDTVYVTPITNGKDMIIYAYDTVMFRGKHPQVLWAFFIAK